MGRIAWKVAVPGGLRRAAGRISLYDKDLAFAEVFRLSQFASFPLESKEIFLLGQHIGLGFFLCLSNLGRFFRAADDILQTSPDSGQNNRTSSSPVTFADGLGSILIVQFRLSLSLEIVEPDA